MFDFLYSELKKVLMWNLAKSGWQKVCKKTMNPKIRMYNENKMIMIAIKDTENVKFNHCISDENVSGFLQKESNLSYQWTATKDIVQNQEVIVHISFKTKTNFNRFGELFMKFRSN